MSYEELVNNISLAGLSIKEFAELIKVRPTSITNLKSDESKIPKALFIISALIRDMKQANMDYKKTISEINFDYKRRDHLSEKV